MSHFHKNGLLKIEKPDNAFFCQADREIDTHFFWWEYKMV